MALMSALILTKKDRSLIEHVDPGDVFVLFGCGRGVGQQVEEVGVSGRTPSSTLIEEFVEGARRVGVSHRVVIVLYSPSLCMKNINI